MRADLWVQFAGLDRCRCMRDRGLGWDWVGPVHPEGNRYIPIVGGPLGSRAHLGGQFQRLLELRCTFARLRRRSQFECGY